MKINLEIVTKRMNDLIEAHELDITLCSPIVEESMNYFVEAEHNASKAADPELYRSAAYMAWLDENEYKMCRS